MTPAESCKACEDALNDHKVRNVEAGIWPSHNRIIDVLLARRLEMMPVYEELCAKLAGVNLQRDLYVFFDGLLCIAATWNPDEVAKSRALRRRLGQVNQKIAKMAEDLAALLDEREELNTHSGFCSDTAYDICQVIEDASRHNGHFNSWVRDPLSGLKMRFDMKYWPSLSECIRVIAVDADKAQIQPSNPTTADATTGKRGGDVDFFKAFYGRLCDEGEQFPNLHPSKLCLTDASFAALASCALDREPDELFDADYVKRWRQRERETAGKQIKSDTA